MGQYIRGYGDDTSSTVSIPSDVDVVAAINSMYTQLTNAYQEMRTLIANETVVSGSAKETELLALSSELNDWKKRLVEFFSQRGASVPSVIDYASYILIPAPFNIAKYMSDNITSTSQKSSIYFDMKRFQVEMEGYGNRFEMATGKTTNWTDPSKDPGKVGFLDPLIDFSWSMLKIGAVGLAIWYGGKYLYNYLDKATLYPKDQLPRYAGGSRKATRRRKRR